MVAVRFCITPLRKVLSLFRFFLLATIVLAVFGSPYSIARAAPNVATRYVRTTGNDWANFSCALATPCRTIAYAIGRSAGGDILDIGAGEFQEFPLLVSKDLTFIGEGVRNTIVTGSSAGSVFTIQKDIKAEIKQLRIRNGKASNQGGGIQNSGTLTVQNVTVSGNQAQTGGGIYNQGTLVLKRVTLYGNKAAGAGGGLYNSGGGTAGLDRANIQLNEANLGGGIYTANWLSAVNSAVHGNLKGGGIASHDVLLLVNVTISGNANPGVTGSGLSLLDGHAYLHYVTITANGPGAGTKQGIFAGSNGAVGLFTSIVYGNGSGSPQCGSSAIGSFSDGGYNVLADQSCSYWPGSGSILQNPKLYPLAYNGGFTPTHALKATSPAIDLVPQTKCTSQDQRGVARPIDGDGVGKAKCDAGAYEFQP